MKLIDAGTVLNNAAKEIFVEMFATGDMPEAIADRKGLKAAPTVPLSLRNGAAIRSP